MLSGLRRILAKSIVIFTTGVGANPAEANSITLPVPKLTIYPGQRIDASMLVERTFLDESAYAGVASSWDQLIGKVARRTLLPEQAIATIAIDNPRLVSIGSRVKIVFMESGVVITGYGIAQQAGSIGDVVQVRNIDSGLLVVGRVHQDGSIVIGES